MGGWINKKRSAVTPTNEIKQTQLFINVERDKWPIIYTNEYNVHFMGIEKLHPFDASKWKHIFKFLKDENHILETNIVKPNKASKDDLLVVHSKRYLNSLRWSWNVALIAEIPLLAFLPNSIVQACYLKPMRYQVGGSILAGKLAIQRGWAINIGGGFHHCRSDKGGGFCPYADITLLINFLLNDELCQINKAMIVDLDAHQGNGHERDFINISNVYIIDIYNGGIYPNDKIGKKRINKGYEMPFHVQDEEYLEIVESLLEEGLREFHPDLIVYNAGTDILKGDILGLMDITPEGVIRRDELVFMKARERRVPIVMLTSGGYSKRSARVIADSIINLIDLGLITGPTF